ncbi:hypothetical protein F0562_022988 [Nyssa sinensis]|uniref:Fe2OG dioxygenase domain-containing protein n=1 Tax=Nyssa sinensis TaxID=561372 RepID=A0A5J5BGP0_9ASTE|nr:hypothetical protein F0562_022988 [Nyssa sinensis]
MGSDQTLPKLPIIDFSEENLKPGSISWLSTSKEVQCALEEYGCFVAVYKQFPLQLHHAMIHALEELMDLPLETKVQNDDSLIRYFQPGPTMPLIKGFRLKNPTTLEATQRFTDVMWPTGHDSFCETALSFAKLISKLHQMVLRMVFESYGVEKHYESHIASTTYHMGLVRYRPPAMDEINVGRTAHTDKGIINILDQNLVKALEIELKDGNWMTFEPAPSHFVVFAGDAFLGLGTDSGGTKEIVEHNVTGLLHPVGRPGTQVLSENLGFLLKNPLARQEMGMRGRKKVEKKYLKRHMYKKFAAVLFKCMRIK